MRLITADSRRRRRARRRRAPHRPLGRLRRRRWRGPGRVHAHLRKRRRQRRLRQGRHRQSSSSPLLAAGVGNNYSSEAGGGEKDCFCANYSIALDVVDLLLGGGRRSGGEDGFYRGVCLMVGVDHGLLLKFRLGFCGHWWILGFSYGSGWWACGVMRRFTCLHVHGKWAASQVRWVRVDRIFRWKSGRN